MLPIEFLRGGRDPGVSRAFLLCLLALGGCVGIPFPGGPGVEELQASTQFSTGPLDGAWVAPQGGLVAIDRKLGTESEQVVGLVNNTTLPGDNFLRIRARGTGGTNPGRFQLDDFIKRFGGVPAPFAELSDSDLRSGADSLGPFFWLEYQAGSQTNCVLAIRRIDASRRILPPGTTVLEVMLRNCVQGSVEEALNPIRDSQIGVGAVPGGGPVTGGTRMLSPLAAPLP